MKVFGEDRAAKEAVFEFMEFIWNYYWKNKERGAENSKAIVQRKTDETLEKVEKNDALRDRVMTLKEASKEYFRGNVGYNKLRAMAKSGELPVKIIGNRYFTKKEWLDQWLDDSLREQSEKKKDKPFGPLRQLK